MLTVLHPDLMHTIRAFPGGLLPLRPPGNQRSTLVVKVPKEYILAAKINRGFKIYLTPVLVEGTIAHGVITAFFDDADEPLTLTTPLFDDDFARELFAGLRNGAIDVHFFDELARERLVYRANANIPDATSKMIDGVSLLQGSISRARAMVDGMQLSFGLRTKADDAGAIHIELLEAIYGEDLFIQDMRPANHAYHGSSGFSQTTLDREEPGRYQEEDIIQCLLMIFPSEQIYLSPKRSYDGEEICDILVVTPSTLLIIQAKDSPNVERISRQKLSRKRAATLSAVRKAIAQVKGAVGYCRRGGDRLELLIGSNQHFICTNGRVLKSLIVVKELFNDQFDEYSQLLLALVREKATPCVALDYPEFFKYCAHLDSESGFFEAYDAVMSYAEQHRRYPRLRFGMI